MVSKLFMSLHIILLLSFFSFSPSHADTAPSAAPVAPNKACNSTPYPNLCKSLLPHDRESNLYDYGRFSIRRSVSAARKFANLVDRYLKRRSTLSKTAIQALQDCHFLSGLTQDFLLAASATVNGTNNLLNVETFDVQTLLSAIITNQLTCLDGLQSTASAWGIKNGLSTPLSNDTKLFSVSLALFTHAWVNKRKKVHAHPPPGRKMLLSDIEIRRLPLRMSNHHRNIFERRSQHKLLQLDEDDSVFVNDIVVVSQDGTGNFTTINGAVAATPNNTNIDDDGFFLIYVVEGVYEEYVSIAKNKKNLMMVGDGINRTVITGNRSFVDGWTTFNSATFAVVGQGFVAINITFRNTAGPIKHQAVAVRNGADLSTFYSCSFEGYQDTLYAHSLRQFYRECDIYGTVDFIFGNAAAVFQNCNIYARLPLSGQTNEITAQGRTDINQNTGISIHHCRILAASDLASSNETIETYLGRPWKQYSRTVYMQSFMDSLINPAGWQPWDGDFALSTLYYAEYNNTGPGSGTTQRVNWPGCHVINGSDASNFTVSNFLLGNNWLPLTGVPYIGGLL